MASIPPKKNAAFTISLPILDADGDLVPAAATLSGVVAGADGVAVLGAFGATATPTDEGEGFYDIALTAGQMNFDRVAGVLKTSTAGAKNTAFTIYTSVRQVDDLAFPNVSGRGIDVDAAGGVEVGSFQAGAITAAAHAAGAIDAAALSADAGTEIAAAVWNEDATGHQTLGTFGQAIGDPVADTNTIYKAVVTDATGATVGVDVVAVKAETVTILADTDNIQTRLPAALVGGRMDSDVAVIQAGAITAAAIATGAIDADAIALDAANEILGAVSGTADSGSTTTVVDVERTEADTDYWKGSLITFTSGTLNGQTRLITAFNAATDTLTFAPALTVATGTHTYRILPAGRVDVHFWLGTLVNALIAGRVDANAQVVGDKTGYSLTQTFPANFAAMVIDATGIVDADVRQWLGLAVNALIAGRVDANAQVVGDKTGYALTAAAEAAIVNQVWDETTAEARVAATYGQLLKDNMNATISSRSIPGDLMGLVASAITAAKFAVGAIDAAAIAADAIGASEFSQAAADKVFGTGGATLGELAQGIPTATPRPDQAMMALYMSLRNLLQVTATEKRITNDAGTVIFKKALSDDGSTYAEAEAISGP